MAPVKAAALPAPPAEKEGFLRGLVGGLYSSTLKPLGHMIAHPIETAEGIGHAVAHPVETAHAIGHAVSTTAQGVMSGDGRSIGMAVGTVGMLAVPGAGEAEGVEDAARVGQIGEAGEVAGTASEVAPVAEAAPIAEAAPLAEAAPAADEAAGIPALSPGADPLPAPYVPSQGTAFFGEDNLTKYYSGPDVNIGGAGRPFFFMPEEDSAIVQNSADAARYTGMAPSAANAYLSGGETYGMTFPTEGMPVSVPTAADAGGWPHFLEGGNTAVLTEGPNAGYLVNPTREFVVPGGAPAPSGTTIFQLGADGTRTVLRTIP